MTTPQPAALPEHSAAIEQLKMAAANFENAASVPNVPNAGDYAQKAREIRASIAALQSQPAAAGVSDAAMKDAVFEASIEFIGTLTGMQPPPIETAPPEVFKPFRDFTEKVCAILALRMHASASAAGQATPQADPLNPGWCVGCDPENCIGCGIGLNEPHHAILALRPQAVPMTDEQRALIIGRAADKTVDRSAAALYAICETERLYGITAQGGEG